MVLGYEINKNILDHKCALAVLKLRDAFEQVETVAKWLANQPNVPDEPLVSVYNYTPDEAYVLRLFFETFNTVRINNAGMFDTGRKMTGLE